MKKTIYTLFLLLTFVCLGGFKEENIACAKTNALEKNSFRIVRKIDAENKIFVSYIFPVNTEFVKNNFSEKEFATYKFYLSVYVNALQKANKDKEIDGVSVGPCLYYVDIDGIGFTISFANVEAQKAFFETKETGDKTTQTKRKTKGLFLQKTYLETDFPISTKESAENFKSVCNLAILSWCKECDILEEKKELVLKNLDGATYIYDFASKSKTLMSEDMYDENGFHHNVFSKSIAEIENGEKITFWTTNLNKGAIYILTLVLVLIGTGVALLIAKREEKKKEKTRKIL